MSLQLVVTFFVRFWGQCRWLALQRIAASSASDPRWLLINKFCVKHWLTDSCICHWPKLRVFQKTALFLFWFRWKIFSWFRVGLLGNIPCNGMESFFVTQDQVAFYLRFLSTWFGLVFFIVWFQRLLIVVFKEFLIVLPHNSRLCVMNLRENYVSLRKYFKTFPSRRSNWNTHISRMLTLFFSLIQSRLELT